MHSSVRAVEAYRRTRLIDVVTSDEDKIAPVYRLEEIFQVLRSSPLDVVREMLEYTLKRLDHKNPIVKQKTLRLIKYAAGKGGSEFKREMQRQAGVVRSLFHYKGQLDALKGDALNKAVRDTAHEAITAIFSSEEMTARMEEVGKRIQGFGNTNYDNKSREEEKKSVFSGLVGFGSQSLRQSIDMIQNYNHYTGSGSGGNRGSLSGTYRSQGLRRSLTAEREKSFQKEEAEHWNLRDAEAEDGLPSISSKNNSSSKSDISNSRGVDGRADSTVESRLLDSLTAPGGVRLQPTRETLQAFVVTAQKLDAANLVNSLEIKLKAHSWQVRFKALCLIETSIREREENKVLDSVTAMFEEDARAIADSLQSPQASLRDKAKKVLSMVGGGVTDGHSEEGTVSESKSSGITKPAIVDMPDLMDTGNFELNFESESLENTPIASMLEPPVASVLPPPVQHDLFGDWLDEPSANFSAKVSETDPFAGMSFHGADNSIGNSKEPDLFSGLDMDSGREVENGAVEGFGQDDAGSSLFDGLSTTHSDNTAASQDSLVDLMGSLSTSNGIPASGKNVNEQLQSLSSINHPQQRSIPPVAASNFSNVANVSNFFQIPRAQGRGVTAGVFPGTAAAPQMFIFPQGNVQYMHGFPAGIPGFRANAMLQPGFTAGPMNLTGVNAAFPQQQFAPGFPGMPRYGGGLQTSNSNSGGLQSYPDNFDFSGDPEARYATSVENTKDTKAFDFISDHMSSQLGPKKSR